MVLVGMVFKCQNIWLKVLYIVVVVTSYALEVYFKVVALYFGLEWFETTSIPPLTYD